MNLSPQAKAVVKDFAEMIAGRSPQAAAAGARESPHASTPMADDFVSLHLHLHDRPSRVEHIHFQNLKLVCDSTRSPGTWRNRFLLTSSTLVLSVRFLTSERPSGSSLPPVKPELLKPVCTYYASSSS